MKLCPNLVHFGVSGDGAGVSGMFPEVVFGLDFQAHGENGEFLGSQNKTFVN